MPTNVVSIAQQGPAGASPDFVSSAQPGTSNVTATLQGNIDALYTAGGGILKLNPGDYYCDALSIPSTVGLRSNGRKRTRIISLVTSSTPAIDWIDVGYQAMSPLEDIGLKPYRNTAQIGIRVNGIYTGHINRTWIDCLSILENNGGFTTAAIQVKNNPSTANSGMLRISNTLIGNGTGDAVQFTGQQNAAMLIESCSFQGCRWGVNSQIDASSSWSTVTIIASDIEGMSAGGITGSYHALNVMGCHLEAGTSQTYPHIWIRRYPDTGSGVLHGIEGLSITGNNFINNAQSSNLLSAQYPIYINPYSACHGGTVSSNYFATHNTYGQAAMFFNATSGVSVFGNTVLGTGAKLWQLNQGGCKNMSQFNNNVNGTIYSGAQFARVPKALVLANGANHNLAVGSNSATTITGPTGAFSISGFSTLDGGATTCPQDGWEMRVFNKTAQAMTITNKAGSTAGNQIDTLTGADVVLAARTSSATFAYDESSGYWILMGYNG